MTAFLIILLIVALYRFALPLILQPSKRSWLLWGERAGTHYSFMVGDHAPTLMFYLLRPFLPIAEMKMIDLAGVHEIPIWTKQPEEDSAPDYIQTYYYLNLLNRRSLQIIKQVKVKAAKPK